MDRLYVITRADLPAGAQAAQSCHCLAEFLFAHPELAQQWFRGANNLVVLAAPDERALEAVLARSRGLGVPLATCREPDLGNELTGVALGQAGARLVSSLPLALREARAKRVA